MCCHLWRLGFHKQIDDSIADTLMVVLTELTFDDAEVYALGESEKMMGRVLKKKRDHYLLHCSSKTHILAGAVK